MTSFDHVGSVFLRLTVVSGVVAGGAAVWSLADDPRRGRLVAVLAADVAAGLGLAFTRDVVMFWGCSALTSLSVWPLIAYHGRGAKARAGHVFMAFAIMAEVLLAAGLIVVVARSGLPSARGLVSMLLLTATGTTLVMARVM